MDIEVNEDVVFAGIEFIREVTRVYGPERGQAIFEALGHAMGEDVKGAVFFSMLTSEFVSLNVKFRAPSSYGPGTCGYRKVEVIKAMRAAADLGLKEAKDLVESSEVRKETLKCASREHAKALRQAFRNNGFTVG